MERVQQEVAKKASPSVRDGLPSWVPPPRPQVNSISGMASYAASCAFAPNLYPNLYLHDFGERVAGLSYARQGVGNPYAEEEAIADKLLMENLQEFKGQVAFDTTTGMRGFTRRRPKGGK